MFPMPAQLLPLRQNEFLLFSLSLASNRGNESGSKYNKRYSYFSQVSF